ncbi:MAG: ribbon-helix-helix protein, CopG family [Chloroflexi bacterium]|nr:ribbon-helix-helix protein, CopG family [Chloroflexota bacterium]
MTIDIPEDLALRLEELAKRNDADVGDLLRDLLARYEDERAAKQKRWATGADFARNAKAAGLASPEPLDTSARSREILNTEFADYLKRRSNR